VIEHWYTATWAYNGLAYVNNPSNPNYDPGRGVWDPAVGGGAPYQEKVFGWMEHTGGQWDAVALAYPNPGDAGASGSPPALPEPSCASPTDGVATRPPHATACDGSQGAGGAGGGGAGPSTSSGGGDGGSGGGVDSGGGTPIEAGNGPSGSGSGGDDVLDAGTPRDDGDCGCRAPGGGAPSGSEGAIAAIAGLALLGRAATRRRRRPRAR
jgi:MYXO-CTERM domain-containing protein